MALTQLQSNILRCLAKNRSETSYLAGGLMLNKNWKRRSDDIDIFHDTDEEFTPGLRRRSKSGLPTHIQNMRGCSLITGSGPRIGERHSVIPWRLPNGRRN